MIIDKINFVSALELSNFEGQTDRQTQMTKLIGANSQVFILNCQNRRNKIC